jgi:hypothetical protein
MAARLNKHEIESLIRSAAMAPLQQDTVRRILEDHRQLLDERAALETILKRFLPAWGEVRAALNELSKRLDP